MKTDLITQFIAKYNLPSGEIDNAKWKATASGKLSVRFTSSDETCFGYIETQADGFPAGDFCVGDTATLRSLMGVLGDDIAITVKSGPTGDHIALLIADTALKGNKVSYGLTDVRMAKKNRAADAPIDTSHVLAQIAITPDFTKAFLKARGALRDIDSFTIWSDGTVVEIVIGYEQRSNSNRATLNIDATQMVPFKHINFENKYLYDILNANKTAGKSVVDKATGDDLTIDGMLEVVQLPNESPFIRVTFKSDEYQATYIIAMKSKS